MSADLLKVQVPRRGLNLRDGYDLDNGYAVKFTNVVPSPAGGIESRPGTVQTYPSAHGLTGGPLNSILVTRDLTSQEMWIVAGRQVDGINHMVRICRNGQPFYDALSAGQAHGFTSIIRHGGPTFQYAYAASFQGVYRFPLDGTLGAHVTITYDGVAGRASPGGELLGRLPQGNRLICARFLSGPYGPHNAQVDPDMLWFSKENEPEAFDTTDYIRVGSGDGEKIQAIVNWRDQTYIFKETKFFVITGVGVGSAGQAIFYDRSINVGVGCAHFGAAVAGEDGVYFVGRRGLYVSRGGEPELLSEILGPAMDGAPREHLSPGLPWEGPSYQTGLSYARGRVYLALSEFDLNPTLNMRKIENVFVYDTNERWWAHYTLPIHMGMEGENGLVFATPDTRNGIDGGIWTIREDFRDGDFEVNDNALPIECEVVTGFTDGGAGEVKRARSLKLWGRGAPSVKLIGDYWEKEQTPAAQTLGDGVPRVATHNQAMKATAIAVGIEASVSPATQAFSVDRLQLELEPGSLEPGVGKR